jgi:hypothetical protein
MSEIQNIKTCKLCGSTTNHMASNRRTCTKCRSKHSNELAKSKNYFKTYYETNKETFLMKSRVNYIKKKGLEISEILE